VSADDLLANVLANVLAARQFAQAQTWQRVHTERRRDSWENEVRPNEAWGMAAARLTIPNAFPDLYSNSILFTAAFIRAPIYDARAPLEVRLGGFGAVAGHEMMHSLDGHEYDDHGELNDAWTAADTQARKARFACVIGAANAYTQSAPTPTARARCTRTMPTTAPCGTRTPPWPRRAAASSRPRDLMASPCAAVLIAWAQHWCEAERPEARPSACATTTTARRRSGSTARSPACPSSRKPSRAQPARRWRGPPPSAASCGDRLARRCEPGEPREGIGSRRCQPARVPGSIVPLRWPTCRAPRALEHDPDDASARRAGRGCSPRSLGRSRHAARRRTQALTTRGRPDTVVQLIDVELAATPDPARQADLWLEKGLVLDGELLDVPAARAAFDQVRALRPTTRSRRGDRRARGRGVELEQVRRQVRAGGDCVD